MPAPQRRHSPGTSPRRVTTLPDPATGVTVRIGSTGVEAVHGGPRRPASHGPADVLSPPSGPRSGSRSSAQSRCGRPLARARTPDPARPSDGRHQPKPSATSYDPLKNPVLRPPLEPAVGRELRVEAVTVRFPPPSEDHLPVASDRKGDLPRRLLAATAFAGYGWSAFHRDGVRAIAIITVLFIPTYWYANWAFQRKQRRLIEDRTATRQRK